MGRQGASLAVTQFNGAIALKALKLGALPIVDSHLLSVTEVWNISYKHRAIARSLSNNNFETYLWRNPFDDGVSAAASQDSDKPRQ